jgi:hypothetical protein
MGTITNDIPDVTVVVTKGNEYITSITPSEIYQVLVNTGDNYNVNINQPNTIVSDGSGSYITVADYASHALTSSYAQTASYVSGAASDWAYITNKPAGLVSSSAQATTWTVLSASHASTVAAVAWNAVQNKPSGLVSSSTQVALNQISGSTFKSGSYTFPGNVTVAGLLSASALKVNTVISESVVTGGITGSLFGTASYALSSEAANLVGREVFATTGSNVFTNSQIISGSLTLDGGHIEISSSKVTNIYNQTKLIDPLISSIVYSGINVDYTAQRTGEVRTGILMASWSGSSVTYTDVSNTEISSVDDLSFDFIKVGDDIRFRAFSAGSGSGEWTIHFLFKLFPNLLY